MANKGKHLVILDAGHGGLDPVTGKYHCIAGGKMFRHGEGLFHRNGWFYEGVFNRHLSDYVALRLREENIACVKTYDPLRDTRLWLRTAKANLESRYYARSLFISNHANASPAHNARGWEVYTSPGKTEADTAAELLVMYVQKLLGDRITIRTDMSDGDHDKEARFAVLTGTLMPALLVENLFFDNYADACLLMQTDVLQALGNAQVAMVKSFFNLS